MTKTARLIGFCALLLTTASAALANPYADNLSVRVLPGWRDADGTHVAGLEITLAEGWKTYWRNPGSAGVPPRFDWAGSENLRGVDVVWPSPDLFETSGITTIGYKHRVILPLRVVPMQQGRDVELDGRIDLGICEDVCVPISVEVDALLPAGLTHRDPQVAAALAQRPFSAKEAKVAGVSCRMAPAKNGLTLEARINMPTGSGDEHALVESSDPGIWISDSRAERQGETLVAQADIASTTGGAIAVDRSALRFTVFDGRRTVEIAGCDAS